MAAPTTKDLAAGRGERHRAPGDTLDRLAPAEHQSIMNGAPQAQRVRARMLALLVLALLGIDVVALG